MATKREKRKLGREELQRIIAMCMSVEERGLDPFLVDVEDLIKVIREYFPEWKLPEDLVLDAETIHHLASVIKMQSEWVKHRSTSLYTDPFLLEEKIRRLSREQLATIFLKSYHPIVELEQISPHSLMQAVQYWKDLIPLDERWKRVEYTETSMGVTSREEMIEQKVIAEKRFSEELEAFWRELLQKTGEKEKIEYWDFIGSDDFKETVRRAYLASFLVTYGYATLEIDRLEEIVFIKPHKKPIPLTGKKEVVSVPVSVSYDDWMKWKEARTS
ncbi:MAG: hypothetical protein ACQXXH_00180 [Candidatus Bathyarchaeia archaeon]|jgi:hypothetical protein|nr:hypothetical protein [Candidatus Bathyarchaeota archaeon A05DMB-4]MDH7595515.1 hypothetical protein [Candidatus Bathyarchaeota archaeon]